MQNIINLQRRGMLTEQQVLVAYKFSKNPNSYSMSPTFYRVLHDAILMEEPLEKMEKRRGWPVRSAKAIISLILHAMQETQGDGTDPPTREEVDAKERLEYLTAEDITELSDVQDEYKMSHVEARMFIILKRAPGRSLTRESLYDRLYGANIDEGPEPKTIDVHICKLRKKLKGTQYSIETIWGTGYRLTVVDIDRDSRALAWYVRHVEQEESLRAIARSHDVQASTVMRAINKFVAMHTDEDIKRAAEKYLAENT